MERDDAFTVHELLDLKFQLLRILESEELTDFMARIIRDLFCQITAEGPEIDETEMLTRLHVFLMKRGADLDGV